MNRTLLLVATVSLLYSGASRYEKCLAAPAPAPPSVVRGQQVFTRMNCVVCHPGGANAVNPSKPLKGAKFNQDFKDDKDIEKIVRSGVRNTPMPDFDKSQISDLQMKDLIAYIRSFSSKSAK